MLSQFPTIVDALEWHAAERPQQTAITFLEGEAPPISWTYEQLTRRAKAIAEALRSMNLDREDSAVDPPARTGIRGRPLWVLLRRSDRGTHLPSEVRIEEPGT